ncbi:MAG: hypothetical protein ACOC3A_03565, partial [Thermodesulfobacteriota bacterium]
MDSIPYDVWNGFCFNNGIKEGGERTRYEGLRGIRLLSNIQFKLTTTNFEEESYEASKAVYRTGK